jgi:hypothetical protein
MENYEILIKSSVEKDIKAIPKADLQLIFQRIEDLRSNPRPAGCEKVTRSGFFDTGLSTKLRITSLLLLQLKLATVKTYID